MTTRPKFQTTTPSGVPYAICCAYFGGVDDEHQKSVLALEYGDPEVKVFRTHGVPYIDQARAILAEAAMRHLPDEAILVSLDHDIVFHPLSVPILAERCATGPFDVLAVPYSMRKEGGGIIGFPEIPDKGKPFELDCFEAGTGKLYPAFGCGMGFTAIRMRVFRELAKTMQRVRCGTQTIVHPFFKLEVQPDHSVTPEGESIGFYHGEDVSFCRRVTAAGMKVGLDTEHRIGHKGAKIYGLEDCLYMVPLARRLTMQLVVPENPAEYNFRAQAAPAVVPHQKQESPPP